MQKFVLIFLIAFSFVFVQAQTTPLQEAEKLALEVVRLYKEKKFEEAQPLAQRVVSIREKALGKNHPMVAGALRNLGYIQLARGELKSAGETFRNAFEIYEKNTSLSAADEKIYAEMLETVAIYEANDADITGAEKKLKKAVELYEKLNGKDSLETADALVKLAKIYELEGNYDKAAPVILRSLDIKSAKLGISDNQTREIYSTAYCTLNKLERTDEAVQLRDKFNPKQSQGLGETEKTVSGNVKGGVVNSKAINLVKPVYPYAARAKRASGAVNVEVTIDEKGNVIFACALSGAKELQRVSEIAAYQSKFAPTLLSGTPVKVIGIIVYNYVP